METTRIPVNNVGENSAEVLVFDRIGGGGTGDGDGLTAKEFAQDIKKAGNVSNIDARINSPGGSVRDGIGIFNTLDMHPAKKTVTIEGAAWSIASVIAMAANRKDDVVRMTDNSLFMIHNPSSFAQGDSDEMRRRAEFLDKSKETIVNTYMRKVDKSRAEIEALMDNETWLTAEQAHDMGFVDEVITGAKMVAFYDVPEFISVPGRLQNEFSDMFNATPEVVKPAELYVKPEPKKKEEPEMSDTTVLEQPKAATLHDLNAALPGADAEFVMTQALKNATLTEASQAWNVVLQEKNSAMQKEIDETKKKAEEAENSADEGNEPIGTRALNTGGGADGEVDAVAEWDKAIAQEIALTNASPHRAVLAVNKRHPGLREKMVEAVNSKGDAN